MLVCAKPKYPLAITAFENDHPSLMSDGTADRGGVHVYLENEHAPPPLTR